MLNDKYTRKKDRLKHILQNKFFLFTTTLVLFIVAHLLFYSSNDGGTLTVSDFEKTLHKKEQKLEQEMLLLSKNAVNQSYSDLFYNSPDYYKDLLKDEGIALLIYENDTLKFWSDNSIAIENWIKEICLDTKIAKFKNGWFEIMKPISNANTTKIVIGLILIKNEYPYQNNYLANEFQQDFSLPAETKLLTAQTNESVSIKNKDGDYLFSLLLNPANNVVSSSTYFAIFLDLLALFLLFFLVHKIIYSFESKIGMFNSVILYFISLVLIRYVTIKFSIPHSFYAIPLFSPNIYADARCIWLSSLGDLLINVSLLFQFVFSIYDKKDELIYFKIKNRTILFSSMILLGFLWFSWIINELLISIIENSNIPFSINDIFSLTIYTYIALLIVAVLLFIFFLITYQYVVFFKKTNLRIKEKVIILLICTSIHIIISHFLGILDLIIVLWPILLILSLLLFQKKQFSFSVVVLLVFIFSLYSVHVFIKYTGIKELETQKIYAEKLAAEQDPIAELLYSDIEKKIVSDSILISYLNLSEKNTSDFEKRIKQQYFSGFWEKYDVKIALFDSMCFPIIKAYSSSFDNNLYFDELIHQRGRKTQSENLFFIHNSSGKINYLAKINLFKNLIAKSKLGTLYIELDAKFISDEIGFPELLLDKNIGLSQELSSYTYAKYKNGRLINQYGKYAYNNYSTDYEHCTSVFEIVEKGEYRHLVYSPNKDTKIILSKRDKGFIEKATIFSYMFTLFCILLLLILFIRQILLGKIIESISFKNRIQALLVIIILISLALFGGGTIYYINQQFEAKNRENISEKTHSILMDLETKFENESFESNHIIEYTTFILKKISNIFFTDINIYDTKGNLFASSRNKVFDEGLTSKKMNPIAFKEIGIIEKSEFIHDEKIGKLKYLSSYIPFKNKEGKTVAYINIPYFAKQSELEKEISGFLVALINIYVLLFALSIITAIIISNYVTKPLKLIQDKLGNIKLGKANEPISWSEKDEIGNLIGEYNRMIEELSKSAELLAKSERESAWREMAKQVAHEIKNPLTPMKLSVQHLQRTYKDHAPDMDEKIERLTKTIIDQIETLSTIATEFSNFAKMPKTQLEQINLNDVLLGAIELFEKNEKFDLTFENQTIDNPIIQADKEQLVRIFNNIIKNAYQSIGEDKLGEINILLTKEGNFFRIAISDNGCGIDESVIDKIFMPNFTTKTGGMGLGLAMVKNMVESFSGKIWFKTKINSGTTFFIELPESES